MGIISGIAVFFVIWWTALFTVLPFSLVRDETGKPNDPKLKVKFLYTTLLSAALWLCVYGLIQADIISFRVLADHMIEEDMAK